MIRLAIFFLLILFFGGVARATQVKYNPHTGRLDFVGTSTTTLSAGSTNYIQNRRTLQSGATAYPAYLYCGSSASINGPFAIDGPGVSPFFNHSRLSYDPNTYDASLSLRSFGTTNGNTLDWTDYLGNNYGEITFIPTTSAGFSIKQSSSSVGSALLNRWTMGRSVGDHVFYDQLANPMVQFNPVGNSSFTIPVYLSTLTVTTQLKDSGLSAGTSGYIFTSRGSSLGPQWLPSSGGAGTPGGSSGQLQYNNSGAFGGSAAGTYATSGNLFTFTAQAATDVPITVNGASSQSANLQEWKDSGGGLVGYLGVGNIPFSVKCNAFTKLGASFLEDNGSANAFEMGYCAACGGAFMQSFNRTVGAFLPFYAAGDSLNLNTGPVGANAARLKINASGTVTINGADPSVVPFVVKANTSQTVNATEWQNTSGVTVASVSISGNMACSTVTARTDLFAGNARINGTVFTNTSNVFQVGTSSSVAITTSGHIETHQTTTPVVSSCGTSPTMASLSTDINGLINTGSGIFTSCTVTFANTWTTAPACIIEDQTSVLASPPKVTTTTSTMIIAGVTITPGDVVSYICFGNQ